jgi:ankyrin repeat protein
LPQKNTIQFSVIEKKFDLHSAHTQYDFMKSVNAHHKEMSDMEKMMTSCNEKQIDTSTMDDGMSSCNSDSDSDDDGHPPDKEKAAKEQIGGGFKVFYDSMLKLIEECSISASEYSMENVVQKLTLKRDEINCTKDKYERTIFHVAVEEKNYLLVKILLAVGININAKEGCGVTPLSIAVMNNDIAMCKLLLENFAEYNAPFFGTVPSPKEMAVAMELTDIVELFTGYDKGGSSGK